MDRAKAARKGWETRRRREQAEEKQRSEAAFRAYLTWARDNGHDPSHMHTQYRYAYRREGTQVLSFKDACIYVTNPEAWRR